MALETGSYISALVATNPTASDPKSQGDDHLRFVKAKILETFPSVTGAVTPTHTELNYVDGVTSAIQEQLDAKAPLASPTFTGTVTIPAGASITGFAPLASPTFTGTPAAPTATAGTNTTQLATTAFAQALAFAAALPSQTGNAGKYVTTDGSTASWAAIVGALIVPSARTSNTILATADSSTSIDVTSGTFSQTFAAAATLGAGWWCVYKNSGTGVVTLDPNAAELIDGLATYPMYSGEARLITCTGTAFKSVVLSPFSAKFTSSGTHIMPPGYAEVEVDVVGAGGQGGSGRRGAAGTQRHGGAPGGAPARVVKRLRDIAAGTSTAVTIGAGGTTGGTVQTVNDTNGVTGQDGGNTTFGSLVTAYGGCGGSGGQAIGGSSSGSGELSAGTTNTASNILGGLPSRASQRGGTAANYIDNWGTGGAGMLGAANSAAGCSEWGGAASGVVDGTVTTVTAVLNGSSMYGVSAGSSGGWITAADTLPATATATGLNGSYTAGGGVAGGTCGATPTVGTSGAAATTDDKVGGAGAGGGSTITGGQVGKAGGAGGYPGGPGGGGGASLNGLASGAGGVGADGRCIVKGIV